MIARSRARAALLADSADPAWAQAAQVADPAEVPADLPEHPAVRQAADLELPAETTGSAADAQAACLLKALQADLVLRDLADPKAPADSDKVAEPADREPHKSNTFESDSRRSLRLRSNVESPWAHNPA